MQCLTSNDDIGKIMEKDCYLFFYFTASWCGPCKRIYPEIEKLYLHIKDNTNLNIEFYKIDIDENEELCESWKIKGVPTFYLMKQKSLLGNFSGADINAVKELFTHCQ